MNCKGCGVELKTMVSQGARECASCEAKRRDKERGRTVAKDEVSLDDVGDVLLVLIKKSLRDWTENDCENERELLQNFLKRVSP